MEYCVYERCDLFFRIFMLLEMYLLLIFLLPYLCLPLKSIVLQLLLVG